MNQRTVYASTTDLSREGLLRCARSAADALGEGNAQISICLKPQSVADRHPVRVNPCGAEISYKSDVLKQACFAAKEHSPLISQVQGTLAGVDHEILVANSEGLLVEDRHVRTRLIVNATASRDGENQSGGSSPGRSMGMEMFELFDPAEVGRQASEMALVNLRADYCKAGQMTVAI